MAAVFYRAKEQIQSLTKNEVVILLLVLSSFVSVFFLGALILLLPIYMFASGQWKLALPRKVSEFSLMLFALFSTISTFLFAKDGTLTNGATLNSGYLKLLGFCVIVLVFDIFFFSRIMTKKAFRLSLKLATVCSIFCLAIALFQMAFRIYPDPINRPGRVASTFINENYYGTILEFVVLICLFLYFSKRKQKEKNFFFICFILNLIGLWLCQSRMAFIVVAISVIVLFFMGNRRASYALLTLLAAFSLVLIKNPGLLPRFDSISSYLDFRLGIWSIAIRSVPLSPLLGRGFYSYSSLWPAVDGGAGFPALHAHNLYLELLINFGVVGTLFLAVYVLRKMQECIICARKNENKTTIAFVLATILAILIHGCADTTILWPQTGFFAVLLLACPKVYESDKE